MARANKLYVVFINQRPVAGFTVKHEVEDYLGRKWPSCPTNLRVTSIPDGERNAKVGKVVDITAQFYGLSGEKDR